MSGGLLSLTQLLLAGMAVLAVLVASSVALLRQDREARQLGERIDAVATPYARVTALGTLARSKEGPSLAARLLASVGGLFGYSAVRADSYPARAPVVLFFTLVLSGVVSQVAVSVVGPVARMGIPLFWIFASRQTFKWFEARRAGMLYTQFPDALAMIVRSVRVGIPVTESVRNVSREALEPTATEFGMLADQLSIGVPLEDALRDVAARNQLPEYRFFATALSLQAQTGGGLSETLENLADVIRKRVAVRKRAYALASEARTSTYVLAGLPVVVGAALALINFDYISLLFTDSFGNAILGAAVGMLSTGMFIMRTTIRKSLQ